MSRGQNERRCRYVPLMARWRRERYEDMGSTKLKGKPENTQSIRERVTVICTHDAGDSRERKRVRERGETDHGCPSGGIKSEFSTTIEP